MVANLKVSDIMTTDMLVLREEDNLAHVGERMHDANVHHLPVVDGDKLVGMVSQRDVLRYSVSSLTNDPVHRHTNESIEEGAFIASIMAPNPERVSPDLTVGAAAKLLLQNRIGCVPVTKDDGTLLGLVTENDCTRLLVKLLDAG